MRKILLLSFCALLFNACILPEEDDADFNTDDDFVSIDDGASGSDDGSSNDDDAGGSDDPFYGFINFPLAGNSPINEAPQCGQLQVVGRDVDGPPYIAVRGLGVQPGNVTFTSDYYLEYGANTNYADHPYMFVDYRPNNTDVLIYVSTTGVGYWTDPSTYVIIADVRELRRNGAPNFDYYLFGNTFTVTSEIHYPYDALNTCF